MYHVPSVLWAHISPFWVGLGISRVSLAELAQQEQHMVFDIPANVNNVEKEHFHPWLESRPYCNVPRACVARMDLKLGGLYVLGVALVLFKLELVCSTPQTVYHVHLVHMALITVFTSVLAVVMESIIRNMDHPVAPSVIWARLPKRPMQLFVKCAPQVPLWMLLVELSVTRVVMENMKADMDTLNALDVPLERFPMNLVHMNVLVVFQEHTKKFTMQQSVYHVEGVHLLV